MTAARLRVTALASCVAGAALALLASSQVWVRVVVAEEGLPRVVVEPSGRDLAPTVAALGLVGLAGAVALLASRGRARLVAAAVLVAAGVGTLVAAVVPALDLGSAAAAEVAEVVGRSDAPVASTDPSVWPWLAVLAGGLLTVGGVVAFLVGARGAGAGLPSRYDADVAGRRADAGTHHADGSERDNRPEPGAAVDLDDDDAVWKALDRGDDPTDDPTDEHRV